MGIKGIFFKEEAKEGSKPKEVSVPVQPVTQQTVNNLAGVADEKFVEMLWSVIQQNNVPGQDYFEFKQAVDAMASLAIDEKSKFIATFTAQGCKKADLLSSIETYIRLIKQEQSNFTSEFQSQYNEKVKSKQSQIEKAKKEVEELNKKIIETNNFILTASQESQQEELKLQMTSTNFNKSVERVLNTLTEDRQKISTIIPDGQF